MPSKTDIETPKEVVESIANLVKQDAKESAVSKLKKSQTDATKQLAVAANKASESLKSVSKTRSYQKPDATIDPIVTPKKAKVTKKPKLQDVAENIKVTDNQQLVLKKDCFYKQRWCSVCQKFEVFEEQVHATEYYCTVCGNVLSGLTDFNSLPMELVAEQRKAYLSAYPERLNRQKFSNRPSIQVGTILQDDAGLEQMLDAYAYFYQILLNKYTKDAYGVTKAFKLGGRNAKCLCGSGKKAKKCCMDQNVYMQSLATKWTEPLNVAHQELNLAITTSYICTFDEATKVLDNMKNGLPQQPETAKILDDENPWLETTWNDGYYPGSDRAISTSERCLTCGRTLGEHSVPSRFCPKHKK